MSDKLKYVATIKALLSGADDETRKSALDDLASGKRSGEEIVAELKAMNEKAFKSGYESVRQPVEVPQGIGARG